MPPLSANIVRANGRSYNALRPLAVEYDIYPYATGSALFHLGNTKVACSVMLQPGVPPFLKGKKTGWLTAEYSLLPASTQVRTVREISAQKRNGRNIEISRLIGRVLRSIVTLDPIGEQTIFIDCDVMVADGGTRVASISGAYLALKLAVKRWIEQGLISHTIITDELAAVSVGFKDGYALLDLDCCEDNTVDADFNFIVTRSNKLLEIQGGAERAPISWEDFDQMRLLALAGAQELFAFFDRSL